MKLVIPSEADFKNLATSHSDVAAAGVSEPANVECYPHDRLPDGIAIEDNIGDVPVRVRFDRESRRFTITDPNGGPVPFTPAFWFAWQAFHPDTTVWSAQR